MQICDFALIYLQIAYLESCYWEKCMSTQLDRVILKRSRNKICSFWDVIWFPLGKQQTLPFETVISYAVSSFAHWVRLFLSGILLMHCQLLTRWRMNSG